MVNKTNKHISPQIIERKNDHDICRWKSCSWLGTGTKMRRVKPVNTITSTPSW